MLPQLNENSKTFRVVMYSQPTGKTFLKDLLLMKSQKKIEKKVETLVMAREGQGPRQRG